MSEFDYIKRLVGLIDTGQVRGLDTRGDVERRLLEFYLELSPEDKRRAELAARNLKARDRAIALTSAALQSSLH